MLHLLHMPEIQKHGINHSHHRMSVLYFNKEEKPVKNFFFHKNIILQHIIIRNTAQHNINIIISGYKKVHLASKPYIHHRRQMNLMSTAK
jgi:hypothetical protein